MIVFLPAADVAIYHRFRAFSNSVAYRFLIQCTRIPGTRERGTISSPLPPWSFRSGFAWGFASLRSFGLATAGRSDGRNAAMSAPSTIPQSPGARPVECSLLR